MKKIVCPISCLYFCQFKTHNFIHHQDNKTKIFTTDKIPQTCEEKGDGSYNTTSKENKNENKNRHPYHEVFR